MRHHTYSANKAISAKPSTTGSKIARMDVMAAMPSSIVLPVVLGFALIAFEALAHKK